MLFELLFVYTLSLSYTWIVELGNYLSGSSELNLDISLDKNIYLSPSFGSPMILEMSFSWYLAEFRSMYALFASKDSFDESSLYLMSNFFADVD